MKQVAHNMLRARKRKMAGMPGRAESPNHKAPQSDCGWSLLRSRDFGSLFAGQAISQIGDGLSKVALLWFVYELTGSALKTTAIGLLQTLPPLVFGPLIGVYLDRWPKKQAMIWVDLVRTCMIALIPLLYTFQALTLERLYALVFLTAIFSAVFGPALASAVPLIVSRPQLTCANALLQTTTTIGLLIGPALSGIGIALIGVQNVLYVNALTFFISVICLLPIRIREIRPAFGATRQLSLMTDLLAGFQFVFIRHRTVLALMIMTSLYTVGISAFIFLLPVVAKRILEIGPVELGWLWSALGLGMLISSVWLARARQSSFGARLRIIAGTLAIGGIAVAGLGFFGSPLQSAVLVLLVGGSSGMVIPLVWGMLQELTPEQMLGRVFTMFSTGGMAAAMAGMALFGWTADVVSPKASLLGVGLVFAGAAYLAAHLSIRLAPSHESAAPAAVRKLVMQSAGGRA